MNIDKDCWVIIPAYNEGKRIKGVIKDIKKYCNKIIVIDDGSKDNTFEVAKKEKIIVLKHIVNLGKGAALKTGCEFAIRQKAKRLIFIDADGQHDPKDIPDFLKALENCDVVFSYRTMKDHMPFVLKFGNWFINKTALLLFGVKLKDTQCGYRALTAEAYRKIRWKAAGYYVESEIIAKSGKYHLKYKELPIKTVYSDKYKGTTVFDGIKIVFNMFLWRLGL